MLSLSLFNLFFAFYAVHIDILQQMNHIKRKTSNNHKKTMIEDEQNLFYFKSHCLAGMHLMYICLR